MTDRCVQVMSEREQDEVDCRDHLVESDVLPESASILDATAYFENEIDEECEDCAALDGCPVCAKYE